jgi:ABC-type transport system substrate-binding protein
VASTYKRNPDYFDKTHVYLDTWKYAVIPDASQQMAQFTAGNLDELLVTNPYQVPEMQRQNPRAAVLKTENASPNPLYFQLGDPTSVFQDIRVRRAFSMAIDREAIGKAIYDGQSQQMVWLPASAGRWAMKVQELPPDLQQYYNYNPSEAKKLLEAAGQTSLQLKLAYPNTFAVNPVFAKQAETIVNMLGAVGVKATIIVQDYTKDFIGPRGSRNGYFDKDTVMYVSVAPFSDPDEFLFSYFHSKSTANQEHLSDPKFDVMVDKERTIVNQEERLKSVREILNYLAQQMYAPSTVGSYQWAFVQPRVGGYQYTSNQIARAMETYSKLWLKA